MRRLVFITQQVDPAHPLLAAVVPQISALAERVDEVVVLTDGALPSALPDNCRVRSYRDPRKVGRGLRFERALVREVAGTPKPDAIVAHMCPIFALLAAPPALTRQVPLLLWYSHPHAPASLRLATPFVDVLLTVDRWSFPFDSPKLRPIGHAIDVRHFECSRHTEATGLRVLALGRYSPIKGFPPLIRAVRLARDAGLDARLRIHGPSSDPIGREHRRLLEELVRELGLEQSVELGAEVERTMLPGLLAETDVLVNNVHARTADKVVYESAACCVPVLASNPVELLDGYDDLLRFGRDDAADLASRLAAFAELEGATRAEIGRALRERVVVRHSLEGWADRVVEIACP